MGHLPLCTPPYTSRLSGGPAPLSAPAPTPGHCSTPHRDPWGGRLHARTPAPGPNRPLCPGKGLWGEGGGTDHRRNPPRPPKQKASPPLVPVPFLRLVEGQCCSHTPSLGGGVVVSSKGGVRGGGADVTGPGHHQVGLRRDAGTFPPALASFPGPGAPPGGSAVAKGAGAAERLGLVPTAWGGGLCGAAGIARGGPPG